MKVFTAQLFAVSCRACSLRPRHAADGTRGEGGPTISLPNTGPTRQPVPEFSIGRKRRVSETGRTDARRIVETSANSKSPGSTRPAAHPALFRDARSRTPRADDRGMRQQGGKIGEKNSANLDSTFHATTTA